MKLFCKMKLGICMKCLVGVSMQDRNTFLLLPQKCFSSWYLCGWSVRKDAKWFAGDREHDLLPRQVSCNVGVQVVNDTAADWDWLRKKIMKGGFGVPVTYCITSSSNWVIIQGKILAIHSTWLNNGRTTFFPLPPIWNEGNAKGYLPSLTPHRQIDCVASCWLW